jgi:hypothetical protein
MRYLPALALLLLTSLLAAGCCEPEPVYRPYGASQPVYCVPQGQVQSQGVCPPGTVPVCQ